MGRIGTPCHEAHEVHHLGLGDTMLLSDFLPIAPNLGIHHVGKPQPSRKGHGQVLIHQDFLRKILLLERLQQRQRNAGVNAPARIAGEFLGRGRRGEGHGYRGR